MKFYQDDNFALTLDLNEQASVEHSSLPSGTQEEDEIDLRISNQYWNEVLALFAST
jgi:hypothetical protein